MRWSSSGDCPQSLKRNHCGIKGSPAALVDFDQQFPEQYLALASNLSAASSHSRVERIHRAWLAGLYARAKLAGGRSEASVVELDLASSYFVVLQGRGISETKIPRNRREFKDLAEARTGPVPVGHGFPTETESRVFIAWAGRAARHGA